VTILYKPIAGKNVKMKYRRSSVSEQILFPIQQYGTGLLVFTIFIDTIGFISSFGS
jgi:hypothetical protein